MCYELLQYPSYAAAALFCIFQYLLSQWDPEKNSEAFLIDEIIPLC